jgi:hypothetical protein
MAKAEKRTISSKIQYVDIDLISGNKRNPRKVNNIRYRQLMESIKESPEFMEVNPIICNDDGLIISGNQRFKICKELKWKELPVLYLGAMSEEKQNELMYKLNHHAGEDEEKLLFELFAEEQLIDWGHDFKKTPFEIEMAQITDEDAEMPITPKFDEKYGSVTIVFTTENEKAFLETNLDIEKMKAYNSKYIGNSYVITFEKFLKQWNQQAK